MIITPPRVKRRHVAEVVAQPREWQHGQVSLGLSLVLDEALQVNQELGAHLLRVARRLRLEIGRRASSISRMPRVGVALRLPFVGGGSHSPPPRGRKSPRKESMSSSSSPSSSPSSSSAKKRRMEGDGRNFNRDSTEQSWKRVDLINGRLEFHAISRLLLIDYVGIRTSFHN